MLHGDWFWFDRVGSPDTTLTDCALGLRLARRGTILMLEWWNTHTRLLHLMALHRCRSFGSRRGGLCTSISFSTNYQAPLSTIDRQSLRSATLKRSDGRQRATAEAASVGGPVCRCRRRRGGCGQSLTSTEPSDHTGSERHRFPAPFSTEMLLLSWCLMSSDVIWHIRDKLWPMPKHGSIRKVYTCLAVTCHLHF